MHPVHTCDTFRDMEAPPHPTTRTMATTTKNQEIAALNARIRELKEMYLGKGHILGRDSWAADWGRVDDEIIRGRKAIRDSARDQIVQLQARVTELETELAKFSPADAAGRFLGWAALVTFCAAPVYLLGQTWTAPRWQSPLALGGAAVALVAGGAQLAKQTRFTKETGK
jgi:hypothetical protein